ncbi:MAG: hypothetical protein M1817_006174 [Caeruleum heppii]|nr:MAG: hypothetical protein M1817_006174 [Caeruleum heppii]
MPSSTAAFHQVSARRHFNTSAEPVRIDQSNHSDMHSSPTRSTKASASQSKKVDWPIPVRHYVQRAFMTDNSIPGIERGEVENKLKQTITQANENGALHTIDWDKLPLPQQLIQNERANARTVTNGTPWMPPPVEMQDLSASNGTMSKKRKSTETHTSDTDPGATQLPWRNTNRKNVFEDRVTFQNPANDSRSKDPNGQAASKYQSASLEKRQKRFELDQPTTQSKRHPWSIQPEASIAEIDPGPVVGRCQDLEKRYFRLTAAPNPDTVRPLPVLQKTLELLKKKWKKEGNYAYICDQFKSLRQDLTVQHIKNEFTVMAYELHARIALEKGDLGEYNQCQTQLRAMYEAGLSGHPMEFKAYRILYFIHTCNRTDMNDVLADLTPAEKKDEAVKHALDVRSALASGNYHRFFRLYLSPPNMGAYLMDMFVGRERLAALSAVCRAYKPDVKIRFITEELGFESDGETVRFLCDQQAQDFLEERENGPRLATARAIGFFDASRDAAFRKVDIKGQI